MNYKLYTICIIYLLSSMISACKNKNTQELMLLESDIYTTTTNDLRVANIRKNVFINGKDGLRDALVKQAYRHIFSPIAQSKGYEKKIEVLEAIRERQNKILSRNVILDLKVNEVTDQEVRQYFNDNINKYTSNKTYDLSFLNVQCKDEKSCKSILEEMLQDQSFQELSIKKKQENNRNGHFNNTDITYLNDSVQKVIENQTIGEISKPLKYDDGNYLFIQVSKIRPSIAPIYEKYQNSIKVFLNKKIKETKIKELINLIIKNNPELMNHSENSILAHYARESNLDKDPATSLLLDRAKRWVLADYGYYNSFVFDDISIEKIKDLAIFNPDILKKLTRFTLEVTTTSKSEFNNNTLNKHSTQTDKFELITVSEFKQHYPFLKVDLFKIAYNKHVDPIEYDGKYYWVYKSYQGLSNDNEQLLMDYKRFKRFMMGSYAGFMEQIGDKINLKINPIIYSEEWTKKAKSYYENLQNKK